MEVMCAEEEEKITTRAVTHGKSGGIWASSAQKEIESQKEFRSDYRVCCKIIAEVLAEG
jgi:hypothetical protein